VRFVLAGDGTEKPRVEARWKELGVRNVAIHPPIPKGQTRAFYNACDLCLVPLAPVPIFSETVPSKIFEVMACESPVLASVEGEAARIVEASGGGAVSRPGDAEAMAEGIVRILSMPTETRAEMGRRGSQHVAAHFSRSVLADRYLEILTRVAARARATDQALPRAAPVER
jgi:glycosyltransferase involved in cell wall biosynthesis